MYLADERDHPVEDLRAPVIFPGNQCRSLSVSAVQHESRGEIEC